MNFQAAQQGSSGKSSSSRGGSNAGNKSRSSSGKRREMSETERVSRALSKLLRHKADTTKGINLRSDGFVLVREILQLKDFKNVTYEMIEDCVKNNDKQRFTLRVDEETNEPIIRANQGHSISVPNLELETIDTVEKLGEYKDSIVHGTFFDAYTKIVQSGGLSKMTRQHIHFAIGEPEEGHVISGMRKTAEVVFFLDVQKTLDSGIQLFRSENKVVLSPGNSEGTIPLSCIAKIVDRKLRRVLYHPNTQPTPLIL
ncbi:hypothetical protein C9374_004839 [Naegleria lovaniensis]|uniref:2'-phosphotransferase n=1 Tax=Naegleria lovaniensis TaxID=51637 RepID=A0AA88GQX7_NAELO|nr:uncharacterized protein C9374_004839 [Naegleria lovaniensis]KAG2382872.1 hypothetical protein C9374_004839 [Naegleria lovaniensis]